MKILIYTVAAFFSYSAFSATVVKVKSSASIRRDTFKDSCREGIETTRTDLKTKCGEVDGALTDLEFSIQKDVYYLSCIVSASAKCVTEL